MKFSIYSSLKTSAFVNPYLYLLSPNPSIQRKLSIGNPVFGSVGGGPSGIALPISTSIICCFFPVVGSINSTPSGRGTGRPVFMSMPVYGRPVSWSSGVNKGTSGTPSSKIISVPSSSTITAGSAF